MIYIITGGRSSGKTRMMGKLYNKIKGCGYISQKAYYNNIFIGYDLFNLKTKEYIPYIRKKSIFDNEFIKYIEDDRYCFNIDVFEIVDKALTLSTDQLSNVFFGELGQLDLIKNKGFYKTLIKLLLNKTNKSSSPNIILSVLDNNLTLLLDLINKTNKNLKYSIIRKPSICAILLASGDSTRFGNNNKLLELIGNKPIFEDMLTKVVNADVFSNIIVVTKYNEIIKLCEKYWDIECIFNNNSNKGISESIKLGVKYGKSVNPDGYMFLQCDQVFLSVSTIKKLTQAFKQNSEYIISPCFNGILGSPKIFPKSKTKLLLELENDNGGKSIIKRNKHQHKKIDIKNINEQYDIDTKKQYMDFMVKLKGDLN